jgi:hypothetical protein
MKRLNIAVLAGLITLSAPILAVGAEKATTKTESQAALKKEAKISMKKARSIALKTAPGKISSAELERENGKLIYSFDIKTGGSDTTEVNVDAMTGDVISSKVETAAQEAAEKKQEAKEKKTTTTKH